MTRQAPDRLHSPSDVRRTFWICLGILAIGLFALGLALSPVPAAYHFRQFENIKTNFNGYHLSLADRLKGIQDNQGKWEFHLRKLVDLGAVRHERFVFQGVPYTREASKSIWQSACSNFPHVVMVAAPYRATNAPGYGVDPYVLEVWDVPGEMERWSSFVEARRRVVLARPD